MPALLTQKRAELWYRPDGRAFLRLYPELTITGVEEVSQKDLIIFLGVNPKHINSNVFVAARLAGRNGVPVLTGDALMPEIREKAKAAESALFVFGFEPGSDILNDTAALALETGAKIYVPGMANALGAGRMIDLEKCADGPVLPAKSALIFGEDPVGCGNTKAAEMLKNAEFSVVFDLYMTETAMLADVVIPMSAVAENTGTFTNVFGLTQRYAKALERGMENRDVLAALFKALGGTEYADLEPVQMSTAQIASSNGRTAYRSDVIYTMLIKQRQSISAQKDL